MKRPADDATPQEMAAYAMWEHETAEVLEVMMGVMTDFSQLPESTMDNVAEFLEDQQEIFKEKGEEMSPARRDGLQIFVEGYNACLEFYERGKDITARAEEAKSRYKEEIDALRKNDPPRKKRHKVKV